MRSIVRSTILVELEIQMVNMNISSGTFGKDL